MDSIYIKRKQNTGAFITIANILSLQKYNKEWHYLSSKQQLDISKDWCDINRSYGYWDRGYWKWY